ncbi:hypothetical protein HAX54_042001, partial [Datura stramonium]|nr:hypothetical protein [Datura stramonium]
MTLTWHGLWCARCVPWNAAGHGIFFPWHGVISQHYCLDRPSRAQDVQHWHAIFGAWHAACLAWHGA